MQDHVASLSLGHEAILVWLIPALGSVHGQLFV